jgi:nucleotide-binding universal stress UspA family protein
MAYGRSQSRIGYDSLILANALKVAAFNVTLGQLWRAAAEFVPINGQLVRNPYHSWRDIDPALPARPIELIRVLELVTRSSGNIAIVAVVRPSEFALDVEAQAVLENACADLGSQLARLQKRAQFAGIESTAMIRLGHPAQQIVRAAQDWHADLIVIGRRSEGPLAPWFLGSVSKQVLSRAHCAVLVVFERWLIGSVARQVIAYAHCAVTVVRQPTT